MAAKGYTTKEIVQNYIGSTVSGIDSQIDAWIEGVERIIDQITGRNFKADSTASERLYDGDGSESLIIDDATEITKVEIGNDSFGGSFTEVLATGENRYFKYPANATVNGVPVTKIVLALECFSKGNQNQKITAKWGYSAAVPKDITFAATVLVAGIINDRIHGGQAIESESIGSYRVTYGKSGVTNSWADFEQAKSILESYKRYYL